MQFAKYWASATAAANPNLSAWGWSNASEADAKVCAQKRADAFAERFATLEGGIEENYWEYADRPMREPVLQVIEQDRAVVTRNLAGCEILNISDVGFVDVDITAPTLPSGGLVDAVRGIFGKKPLPSPRDRAIEAELKSLGEWVRANPSHGFRVYETAGGLRYLVTSGPMDPKAESTYAMFDALGADPAYRQLCKVQQSFRARLTPKPWRCGLRKPDTRFPYTTPETKAKLEAWISEYAQGTASYSTCRFLSHAGNSSVHPSIAPIVALHDSRTQAAEGLKLA